MEIFLDTNVVIDFFTNRVNSVYAEKIFEFCLWENNRGAIADITLTNFDYIMRKTLSYQERQQDIEALLNTLEIIPAEDFLIRKALSYSMSDFEDAIQIACATSVIADDFITNDEGDFTAFNGIVMKPSLFVETYIGKKK